MVWLFATISNELYILIFCLWRQLLQAPFELLDEFYQKYMHTTQKRGPNWWGKLLIYLLTGGAGKGTTGANTPLVTMLKEALL